MAGFPRRDRAWAQRRADAAGGRPDRLWVWALLNDVPESEWKSWSREQKAAVMEPFVGDGEQLRFARDGEVFVVSEVSAGRSQSEVHAREAALLRKERAERLEFQRVAVKQSRQMAAALYAEKVSEIAPMVVQLEELVLRLALSPDADREDRALAVRVAKDMKDRLMGKPTQAIEVDRGDGSSSARSVIEGGLVEVTPLSAGWTVDEVASGEAAKVLEAGVLEVDVSE